MRLALLALLLVATGCDTPSDDIESGFFSVALSGARTATVAGTATFRLGSCRSVQLSGIETNAFLTLVPACQEDAAGAYSEGLRRGTFAVATVQREGALVVTFTDPDARYGYRATSGTVEITSESPDLVAGRISVEARPLNPEGSVDAAAPALRITGTFSARGVAGRADAGTDGGVARSDSSHTPFTRWS